MSTAVRWVFVAAFTSIVFAAHPSAAQSAQANPAPLPSPSPTASPSSGPSDPCTSLLSLVNRPTVATGSCVFKNGHGDVETGYTNTVTTGTGGGVTVAYPQAFIRAGTRLRNVELEVTPPSVARASAGGLLTGAADAAFGAKWEIGYTSKAISSINVVATVPTGDRAFTGAGSSYAANLNGSYTLNSVFSLSASLGFESLAAPGSNGSVQRTGVFVPALLVTASLPGTSQIYGEISSVNHVGIGLPGRTLYDFGFQKQLGSHMVFDVETGLAPSPAAGQKLHYLGVGLTYGSV